MPIACLELCSYRGPKQKMDRQTEQFVVICIKDCLGVYNTIRYMIFQYGSELVMNQQILKGFGAIPE